MRKRPLPNKTRRNGAEPKTPAEIAEDKAKVKAMREMIAETSKTTEASQAKTEAQAAEVYGALNCLFWLWLLKRISMAPIVFQ